MRSFWIGRLLRHAHVGGQVLTQSPISHAAFASGTAGKKRGNQARELPISKSVRLCLGVGDGTVHRQ